MELKPVNNAVMGFKQNLKYIKEIMPDLKETMK
jgi:hypothetical protein